VFFSFNTFIGFYLLCWLTNFLMRDLRSSWRWSSRH